MRGIYIDPQNGADPTRFGSTTLGATRCKSAGGTLDKQEMDCHRYIYITVIKDILWLLPKDVAPGGVGERGALVLRNMIERAHGVHVEVGRLPLSQLCTTTPQLSVVINISYGSGYCPGGQLITKADPTWTFLRPLKELCCQIYH